MRRRALQSGAVGALPALAVLLGACGSSLDVSHTETPCISPGQVATITTHTPPGTQLSYTVQDDFGGTLEPAIAALTADAKGDATVTWQSPGQLSTTTLHFLLTAVNGGDRATRDIHVVVGGNGRSC